MRAAVPFSLLAACGFTTPGAALGPGDGNTTSDSPIASGDATPPADAMLDAPPDASSCPATFSAISATGTTSRYALGGKASQLVALGICASMNTHVVRIDSQAEATAIEAFITSNSTSPTGLYRVVGARDVVFRDRWHDLDLSFLTFLPWGAGEPTDVFLGGEDCIVLKKESGKGVFGAQECSSQHEFACECD